jgi:zinc protease
MKVKILFLSLLFLPFTVFAGAPNILHWHTSNGAQVYFVKADQLPILDVRVVFKAGSAYDEKQEGIANLVNELLNQGTTSLSSDEIAAALDNTGAQYTNDVDQDKAFVSLRTLTDEKYLTPALKIFSEIISSPRFELGAVTRVKNQTIASLQSQKQDPDEMAKLEFYKNLYGNHPYAHSVLGTPESLAKIDSNQLLAFYQHFYVAKNASIILVGDITEQQAHQMSEQIVRNLSPGQAAPELTEAEPLKNSVVQHINYATQQTTIWLGQLGINYQTPDYYALAIGNQILGGNDLTSLLLQKVREQRGLAYFVFSKFSALQYHGPFFIRLQTRADQTGQALAVTRDTLKQFMENGPSEAQFLLAKKNIIGSFPLSFASNSDILNILTVMVFYGLPLNYLDEYRAKIQAVTRDQVKSAFQRNLHFDKMLILMVGPHEKPNGQSSTH